MRGASAASEEANMIEPLIGLAVAIGLGIYLVVTLIRPERF
jgi:K+-transporting ATPase KdpF subunit